MTPAQKTEAIELLKNKFEQYSHFYLTDTESLTVEQVTKIRRVCFDKQVEMKVAKNTLIKRALDSIDSEKYAGLYSALNGVTALMFSDSPKDPAVIISSFRDQNKSQKPLLKAAFVSDEIYLGDDQLAALKSIKTKEELIGEVISLLQSPISRIVSGLQQKAEKGEMPATALAHTNEGEAPAAGETPAAE